MEYKIILNESDYLAYQLFTASRSEQIAGQRKRSWVISVVSFAVLTFLFYQSGNQFLAYYFLAAAAIFLVLYPFYSRWRYKRYYQSIVRETYKNRFNEPATIAFTTDQIITKDKSGEAKINNSQIEEINETGSHLFIKLNIGTSLIIPKAKIDKLEAFTAELHQLKNRHQIPYNRQLDWRWK